MKRFRNIVVTATCILVVAADRRKKLSKRAAQVAFLWLGLKRAFAIRYRDTLAGAVGTNRP